MNISYLYYKDYIVVVVIIILFDVVVVVIVNIITIITTTRWSPPVRDENFDRLRGRGIGYSKQ